MNAFLMVGMAEDKARIVEALQGKDEGLGTHELKIKLAIPNSRLFLALGALAQEGRVALSEDTPTYRATLAVHGAPVVEPDPPTLDLDTEGEAQPVSDSVIYLSSEG